MQRLETVVARDFAEVRRVELSMANRLPSVDTDYESHSTGTFKARASFAIVSEVPTRRPLSRSER